MSPIELFYSYSHKDETLREELEKHLSLLKRQGYITAWHDRKIIGGQEWATEIDTHLNTAKIILLLVSPDFIASDYCYGVEVTRAIERHQRSEALVIPIILRSVDWQGAPFGMLHALPKDAKPIKSWADQDEAFLNITMNIRKAVEEVTRKSSLLQPPDIVMDTNVSRDNVVLNQAKVLSPNTLDPKPLFQGHTSEASDDRLKFTIDFKITENHQINFIFNRPMFKSKTAILFFDGKEIARKRISYIEYSLGDLGHFVKFESKFLIEGLQASFFFRGNNFGKFHIQLILDGLIIYEQS